MNEDSNIGYFFDDEYGVKRPFFNDRISIEAMYLLIREIMKSEDLTYRNQHNLGKYMPLMILLDAIRTDDSFETLKQRYQIPD